MGLIAQRVKVREIDPSHPDYDQLIDKMKSEGQSKSRKTYFLDIIQSFTTVDQVRIINSIIDDLQESSPEMVQNIRSLLTVGTQVPIAVVQEIWNSERLVSYLEDIDAAIEDRAFDRAISLSYTCLEGFYKAFIQRRIPERKDITEIRQLGRVIKGYLRNHIQNYPDEALAMINNITNTVDRSRNSFSESHFEHQSQPWLAIYIRDLVNTQVRMLLHFI